MNEVDTAWVAGLLEGEGCFSLYAPVGKARRVSVTCCMTDKDVIERLRTIVGAGNVYERKPRKDTWKPAWQWSLTTRPEVMQLIEELYPYMGRRRREKMDEIREFHATNPVRYARYTHGTLSMYKHGCLCVLCRQAKSDYDESRRVHRPKKLSPSHGTNSKYTTGCRCDECKQAHTTYARRYREEKSNELV